MKRVLCILLIAIFTIGIVVGCSVNNDKKNIKQVKEKTSVIREVNIATLDGLPAISVAKLYNESPKIKDGYKAKYIISDDREEMYTSLVNSNVDLAIVTPEIAAKAYNENQKYKIVGSLGMSSYYFVSNEDGIESINDLKDKEVLDVSYSNEDDNLLSITLDDNKLKGDIEVDKLNINDFGDSEESLIAEIKQKYPLNAFVPEPILSTLLTEDNNLRVIKGINESWEENNKNSKGCPQYTVVVREDFLNTNKDFVNSFVGQISSSTDWANSNPEKLDEYLKNMNSAYDLNISQDSLNRSNLKYLPIKSVIYDYDAYYNKVVDNSDIIDIPDESIYFTGN